MSDENTTPAESENIQADKQNPISDENSLPVSPQESFGDTQDLQPTPPSHEASEGQSEPAPENTAQSEPSDALPEAPESSPSDFPIESNDIPLPDSIPLEPTDLQANPASNGTGPQPEKEPEIPLEPTAPEAEPEPEKPAEASASAGKQTAQSSTIEPFHKNMDKLRAKEHMAIKEKKRKKLDQVMALFAKRKIVTNDDVEKFLHVSDATATRYLSQLEQEGKIKQSGKTGRGVSYGRI